MPEKLPRPDQQPPASHDPWQDCTFEGAELATLRRAAQLSFAEKIAWLEHAHRLSLQFQKHRRSLGLPTIFPDGHIES